jgi:hypothetical protein
MKQGEFERLLSVFECDLRALTHEQLEDLQLKAEEFVLALDEESARRDSHDPREETW